MKKLFTVLVVLCSCSPIIVNQQEQPLKYSYLPQKINLDSIMPVVKNVVDTNLKDFKSLAIDSGKLITIYKDTMILRPGILISEKNAALFIYYKTSCEYLDKKAMLANKMYNECFDRSLEAEKLYQTEIIRQTKAAQRTWLEKNIVYFGVLTGLTMAILTEFAVLHTK